MKAKQAKTAVRFSVRATRAGKLEEIGSTVDIRQAIRWAYERRALEESRVSVWNTQTNEVIFSVGGRRAAAGGGR